ncbi:MAG: alpha/beta fold hydrolase [Pseudomonadota bacterium]|nr:alpha/beta fold hydrolase [Pseudomonadota bacterium]
MATLDHSIHGDPGRPPLVLVHALGSDRRMWDDAIAALEDDFFCVAPDLQAAGRTPVPATPVAAEQHAGDLIALADELGLERFAIAGCALGGMVAAMVAAMVPERVSALVMTNPGLRNLSEVKEMLRRRAVEVVEQGMDCLLPAAIDRSFHNQPRDARRDLFEARYRAQDPRGYASSVLGFLDIDIEPVLPRIECPALIITGGQDILMPPEGADAVCAGIRDARRVDFESAAHFVPWQAPGALAAQMKAFLAGPAAAA